MLLVRPQVFRRACQIQGWGQLCQLGKSAGVSATPACWPGLADVSQAGLARQHGPLADELMFLFTWRASCTLLVQPSHVMPCTLISSSMTSSAPTVVKLTLSSALVLMAAAPSTMH